MSNRLCVIDMPGLSQTLLQSLPPDTALGRWAAQRRPARLTPTFPAVTCSVQASLTTGQPPARHGIIANGQPTFRFPQDQQLVDASNFAGFRRQISFWEQSNQFLDVPRFWRGKYKTALLFFQNSMPGFTGVPSPAADIVLTPRPQHGPDGKLVNVCWSDPADLAPQLFKQFGPFPLMNYWGPMAGIASSNWIARAGAWVWDQLGPVLQWVYIPHLDYDLQRFGPGSPQAVAAVRDATAAAEPLVRAVLEAGGSLVLLSEYAMRDVSVCVQPNRLLAEAGLLMTHSTPDGPAMDYQHSKAFAMVDHQIAHVYCVDAQAVKSAAAVLSAPMRLQVRGGSDRGCTHRRCGDLVLSAEANAWFDYRWWTDAAAAPEFANKVDIHRKPGYDPLELFWDRPTNGVSQNTSLIRGSHGLVSNGEAVLICDEPMAGQLNVTDVAGIIDRLIG